MLLPRDPDASARAIRARLRELTGASVAVLVSDSFGRAWRHGQLDVAIGLAGMQPLDDWRGRTDAAGLRAAGPPGWPSPTPPPPRADLARAKDSREPAVHHRRPAALRHREDGPGAAALMRPLQEDLFR